MGVRLIEDTGEFSNPMFTQAAGLLKHVVGFQDITHPGTRKRLLLESAQQTYGLSLEEFQKGYKILVEKYISKLDGAKMVSLSADLASGNYTSVSHQVVAVPAAVVKRAVVAAQLPSTAIWDHKHFWPALAILGLGVALLLVGAVGYW